MACKEKIAALLITTMVAGYAAGVEASGADLSSFDDIMPRNSVTALNGNIDDITILANSESETMSYEGIVAKEMETTVAAGMEKKESIDLAKDCRMFLIIGSPFYLCSNPATGEKNVLKKMDVPAQVIDGRTRITARFMAENFGVHINKTGDTVTFDKDGVKVVTNIGSDILTVTDKNGSETKIKADAKTIVKDGRTLVAARFLDQAFRAAGFSTHELQYKNGKILLNGTSEEFSKYENIDGKRLEILDKLLDYMPGGRNIDITTVKNPVDKTVIGLPVMYSSETNKAKEVSLANTIDKRGSNGVGAVFMNKEKIFMFKTSTLSDSYGKVVYWNQDKKQNVQMTVDNKLYATRYKLKWDYSNSSLVTCDQEKIIKKYDFTSNCWLDLTKYQMVGNKRQIIRQRLSEMAPGFELNKDEVADYLKFGTRTEYSTFEILNYSNGEPALIIPKNGKYGWSDKYENYESIAKAIDKINSKNPKLLYMLCENFGLCFIATNLPQGDIWSNPNLGATFSNVSYGRWIVNKDDRTRIPDSFIRLIVTETAGIHAEDMALDYDAAITDYSNDPVIKYKTEFGDQFLKIYFPSLEMEIG